MVEEGIYLSYELEQHRRQLLGVPPKGEQVV